MLVHLYMDNSKEEKYMDKIKEILSDNCPDIELEGDAKFITGGLIDSVDLVAVISDIEDEFGIEISMEEIVPENFDSVDAIWKMVQRLS